LTRLSIIDLQPPERVPELAQTVEMLGYARFWATEHHSPSQSASPTLVAAVAATATRQIRCGTAGILLSYASPFKVAQDFRLLERLFPGRIDLGVVGVQIGGRIGEALLDGRPPVSRELFEGKVSELAALTRGAAATDDLGPSTGGVPQLWVCGISARAASLAARVGACFAFHAFLAEQAGQQDGPRLLAAYREQFRPAAPGQVPRTAVACYGMCAPTAGEADELWRRSYGPAVGTTGPVPRPSFCGPPADCRRQLEALTEALAGDELVIQCMAPDYQTKVRAYALIAEEHQLTMSGPRETAEPPQPLETAAVG
jgi:luciferase family oxidoreductase group 1